MTSATRTGTGPTSTTTSSARRRQPARSTWTRPSWPASTSRAMARDSTARRRGQPVRIDARSSSMRAARADSSSGARSRAPPLTLAAAHSRAVHALRTMSGAGRISCDRDGAPYPPDAAALHHVFPGGWIWVLRFNNGITSAGAALTDRCRRPAGRPRMARRPGIACSRRCPSVREQFGQARAVLPLDPRAAARVPHEAGVRARTGRCCRRRQASSTRCSPRAFR